MTFRHFVISREGAVEVVVDEAIITPPPALFDVVAVEIPTGRVAFVIVERKSEREAEAAIRFAVMRRGVITHFYALAKAGAVKVGDSWPPPE